MEGTRKLLWVLYLFILNKIVTHTSCWSEDITSNATLKFIKTERGAVCLDGSPAAYYIDQGRRKGVDNWLIFIEGGGWCSTAQDCKARSATKLGSSKNLTKSMQLEHILSRNSKTNPDFFDWNRVQVHYCDGSSFTGDIKKIDPVTNVSYRGARIFQEVIEDLLRNGMKNAKNAILAGGSAGGLTVILHCDRFRSFLQPTARVKCLSDSAYFLHDDHLIGDKKFDEYFQGLIDLQGSRSMLPSSCTQKLMRPSLCFFPQYIIQSVMTPMFIAMSSFDPIQALNNLSPKYFTCLKNMNCSIYEMTQIEGLRIELLDVLPKSSPSYRGMWITNCIIHEITLYSWIDPPKFLTRDGNKTYPQVFGDWFYDRKHTQVIDRSMRAKNCTGF